MKRKCGPISELATTLLNVHPISCDKVVFATSTQFSNTEISQVSFRLDISRLLSSELWWNMT